MLSSTKRRSSVGHLGDRARRRGVSVVPMQVRGPIGMTKKRRPSSAKKVSTRRFGVSRSTMRWMPFEKTWLVRGLRARSAALSASTNGPQALTSTRARMASSPPGRRRRARASTQTAVGAAPAPERLDVVGGGAAVVEGARGRSSRRSARRCRAGTRRSTRSRRRCRRGRRSAPRARWSPRERQARAPGEEAADEPVEPGAEDELPEAVAEAALRATA